jgi:alkaline phosphatase D
MSRVQGKVVGAVAASNMPILEIFMDRRRYLQTLGAASVGLPLLGWSAAGQAAVQWSTPSQAWANTQGLGTDAARVFDLSVSSGDPSTTGVILWTHLRPDAIRPTADLYVQVALDRAFTQPLVQCQISASTLAANLAQNDHTVKLDLDGRLPITAQAGTYFYRFIYDGTLSRTGRCRTLPAAGASLSNVKLGLLTCQDFTNGYYGALAHVAKDDSLDYVLHLGDFIYETAGDPSFQSLPFADRTLLLPSGGLVALSLADYRHLYRTYRADPFLQAAMEAHTFICVPDDHETANDCYWDEARDTLGAPDHPFTTNAQYGNDPLLLRNLKLQSQQAWSEYVPARVSFNAQASHPHQAQQVYRRFQFGSFLDLHMIDTRTYRNPHPCGEGEYGQRYFPLGCNKGNLPGRTLLGETQRDWLLNGLTQSTATWKLLGNQTFMGRLTLSKLVPSVAAFNVDGWDGYAAERSQIANALRDAHVKNFVVVTGDLHSHIASDLKVDYNNINPLSFSNYIGCEFMTPATTSANLGEIALATASPAAQKLLSQALAAPLAYEANPHIRYFNTSSQGYSTLQLTNDHAEWVSYKVDKNTNSANAKRQCVSRQRKYMSLPWLTRMSTLGY